MTHLTVFLYPCSSKAKQRTSWGWEFCFSFKCLWPRLRSCWEDVRRKEFPWFIESLIIDLYRLTNIHQYLISWDLPETIHYSFLLTPTNHAAIITGWTGQACYIRHVYPTLRVGHKKYRTKPNQYNSCWFILLFSDCFFYYKFDFFYYKFDWDALAKQCS